MSNNDNNNNSSNNNSSSTVLHRNSYGVDQLNSGAKKPSSDANNKDSK